MIGVVQKTKVPAKLVAQSVAGLPEFHLQGELL